MSNIAEKSTTESVQNTERTEPGTLFTPRVDIFETDDAITIHGDLPGVAPESLEVHFENEVLSIHGKTSPRHSERRLLRAEYGVGDFQRSFTIGESIAADKISAELEGGVLTLYLPKTDKVKPRRIEVKAK